MKIRYRNFIPEDIDGIIRFWNENSGWETDLDRTEFDLRFCSSPWGPPIIMLALLEAENELAGCCCFIPLLASVNGVEKKCYRPFGAIFKESFSQKFGPASLLTGRHPILQLYHHGARQALENNASLTYLIPDHRWARLSKIMPFQTAQFAMWSFPLPFTDHSSNNIALSVEKIEAGDPQIDHLWEKSNKDNLCTVTKNSLFYNWKIRMRHNSVRLWGILVNRELAGLFTLHFKPDAGQWMIGDLVIANTLQDVSLILRGACLAANREYEETRLLSGKQYKVSILGTSGLEQKIKEFGFFKDSYTFLFAVHLLDGSVTKKEIAPQNWYVSAND